MCRRLVGIALAVMVLAPPHTIRAEVRAITDSSGNYKMTRVLTRQVSGGRMPGDRGRVEVWRPVGRTPGAFALNPDGDRLQDLWPTIAEPRLQPSNAWIFWSRSQRSDYDLVHARWTAAGWSPIAAIHPPIPGNDLDPQVAFDDSGRPYLVWWNEQNGVGRVFFSMLLKTRWMEPMLVSDDGVDARHPRIALDGGAIAVVYGVAGSAERRLVRFWRPATITDDINPLGIGGFTGENEAGHDGIRTTLPL